MKIGIFDPYLDSMSGGEKYMLKAAQFLSQSHAVSVFWDPSQEGIIRERAKNKFDLDLGNITFVQNIFAKTSLFSRYFSTRSFDKIFYLSDGSIPTVGSQLYVHFQFPVEWLKVNVKTKIKTHRVKRFICNSYFTKTFIDKKFMVDSSVLYPPVETLVKNDFEKESFILHVGRFGLDVEGKNYKKQDVMIDTFKKMVDDGLPLWKFIVVVSMKDESDRTQLEGLRVRADKYPIEIIENPTHQRLEELYSKAKIYWHASGYGEDLITHPEKAEHFGISTVEAMAHKAVPIVINAGGQKEIVEDGVSGYLWSSLEELMAKTKDLIENPNKLANLGNAAALASARFSEERFYKELQSLLDIQ